MRIPILYTPHFKRDVRNLVKKYPQLQKDITPILEKLAMGELVGDCLQHINYTVYKVRIKNSNNHKGKSAGYRIIYYAVQYEKIVLLSIYSKSAQSDIDNKTICKIIEEWHKE